MRKRFWNVMERLRSSYWFIPMVMASAAVLLSIFTLKLDQWYGTGLARALGLLDVDSAAGATAVLSTIALSMITVAGVVFSLTMVVLSLTAQQYGPLVVSNFLRDRGNQIVLGTFTATFIYCILIMRVIRNENNVIFIPHVSIFLGLVLSLASLAVMIYFIHHVSVSIRAETIIARISADLLHAIDTLFPERKHAPDGQVIAGSASLIPRLVDAQAHRIHAKTHGYLQMIDDDKLVAIARDYDIVLKREQRHGEFVIETSLLASAWPAERVDSALENRVKRAFIVGKTRMQAQDVEFLFNQLIAIAVRSLSPAINDPFTAVSCIDHLTVALLHLSTRTLPSSYRADADGKVRLIAPVLTHVGMLANAFDQILHYGRTDARVMRHMLRSMEQLADSIDDPDSQELVRRYISLIPSEESFMTFSEAGV
jgi:uncharacterized membrane protein